MSSRAKVFFSFLIFVSNQSVSTFVGGQTGPGRVNRAVWPVLLLISVYYSSIFYFRNIYGKTPAQLATTDAMKKAMNVPIDQDKLTFTKTVGVVRKTLCIINTGQLCFFLINLYKH